jgi:hypothetical protein
MADGRNTCRVLGHLSGHTTPQLSHIFFKQMYTRPSVAIKCLRVVQKKKSKKKESLFVYDYQTIVLRKTSQLTA